MSSVKFGDIIMRNTTRISSILALALVLPGCASIVSDNNSGTYIETDPEKARCELHGQDFKRVVDTKQHNSPILSRSNYRGLQS
jgi:PBP1b-binding outer membrane lipoprotein LpoB